MDIRRKAGWQAMCCGSRHGKLFDVVVGILASGRSHMLLEHYRWLSSRRIDGWAAFDGPSAVQQFYRGLSDRLPMAPRSSPAVAGRVRFIVRPPMYSTDEAGSTLPFRGKQSLRDFPSWPGRSEPCTVLTYEAPAGIFSA